MIVIAIILTGRNDMGYLLDEFKKVKPPTFDGDMKKLEDAEAWILGMNKLLSCMSTQIT